ncbi:hypothetical protein CAPTEDRAFT_226918 [Capitella teleta]|uniref:Uncharacterized protein n=1 Tax=Capitella teleta TaxID=283909 RepID=R7U843_CAPTE|nr:hypothetical protein CAPTEDRAFT_226918 [Capitella teleta]|eukprot:ELT99816.1 hypothetical protein CAPTEDRAFT_226918 [Capitella teleta]
MGTQSRQPGAAIQMAQYYHDVMLFTKVPTSTCQNIHFRLSMPPCITYGVCAVLFVICVHANELIGSSEDDINELLSLNPESSVLTYLPDGITKDDLIDLSKRLSRGFYAARGKKFSPKSFHFSRGKKLASEADEDSLYGFSADDMKRAYPSGFTMPRGRRVPLGFQMVRGKKSSGEKRGLNKSSFFLARGKKSHEDDDHLLNTSSDPKDDLQLLMKYFNNIRTGSAVH